MSSYCSRSTAKSLQESIRNRYLIASSDTYRFLGELDPDFEVDYDCSYVKVDHCFCEDEIRIPYITGLATWVGKKYVYIHKGLNLCNS